MVMAPGRDDFWAGSGGSLPEPWASASRPAQDAIAAPAAPVASNRSMSRRWRYTASGVISLDCGWRKPSRPVLISMDILLLLVVRWTDYAGGPYTDSTHSVP